MNTRFVAISGLPCAIRVLCNVVLSLVLAAFLGQGLTVPASAASATAREVSCTDITTQVSLNDNGQARYTIYGQLCRPAGSRSPLVQVLLPGATYNHLYWDLPHQRSSYSYVHHMNQAGYTTFNVDRIGTGRSSHPTSLLLTNDSNAVVVHQLVQKLRSGEIGGQRFTKVVTVGHSLGTLIGMIEAAKYKDVDGFVATGILHSLNALFVPDLNVMTYPAFLDPKFRTLDPGYLTTRPGERGVPLFYNPGHFDPGALAADEEHARDTVTDLELALFPTTLFDGTTTRITAPTLLVIGQSDEIFCGGIGGADCASASTVKAHEKPYWPNTELSTYVMPNAGHCINMHYGAAAWFQATVDWFDTTFPGAV